MDLPRTASVVVIGGGVVGCSIAYHLARRGQRDVVVLERDAVGAGTTSKAAGGIRAQFPTETEVRFSLESIAVFDRCAFERLVPFSCKGRGAIRAWRAAYEEALDGGTWQGLMEVAAACRRIGKIPGFEKTAQAKARETYWTALVRAREQRSVDGVLQIATALDALGATALGDECRRIAAELEGAA